MVHQYKQGGFNIVIDTYSGAIHAVDEIAYDLIAEFETTEKEALIEKLLKKYGIYSMAA